MPEIKTFLFLDLETTGLPLYEGNRTKITEISMIGVSKEAILNCDTNTTPRVLHKLTLCLNPAKMIHPDTTRITGLDNFMLEYENTLNKNAVETITHFIKHLPQPVCLISHNGLGFDYPLLKKQLLKVSELDEILTNMWCIDSLIAFRKIDEDKAIKQCEISNASVELELVTSTETEESCELFEAERSSAQRKNETTPSNRKPSYAARKRILACDSDSEPKRPTNFKRRLFATEAEYNGEKNPVDETKGLQKFEKHKYRLRDIYGRSYSIAPKRSHHAEADTIQLLKCVIAHNADFVRYAEGNCIQFKDISPL